MSKSVNARCLSLAVAFLSSWDNQLELALELQDFSAIKYLGGAIDLAYAHMRELSADQGVCTQLHAGILDAMVAAEKSIPALLARTDSMMEELEESIRK